MGRGWQASQAAGRRDRVRQEATHRLYGGPPPQPRDYQGCCGSHASYYRRGWHGVTEAEILLMCHRVKQQYGDQLPEEEPPCISSFTA